MARYTGADCRLCRREGAKLFLKGDRCYTDKCAMERRAYAPGEAGRKRVKENEYLHAAAREAEDQAHLRRSGEAVPRVLRHRVPQAGRHRREPPDHPGEPPGQRRVPSGLRQVPRRGPSAGPSRPHPCEWPSRRHPLVPRPSGRPDLRGPQGQGDAGHQERAGSRNERVQVPAWLEVDIEKLQGSVLSLPQRDQIDLDIREQLIVELYSKN